MLESSSNFPLLGAGVAPPAASSLGEMMPNGEENGAFSSLFGAVLKDMNVLASDLAAGDMPIIAGGDGAILPQTDATMAESLPLDGNALPPEMLAEQVLLQEATPIAAPVDPQVAATQSMLDGAGDSEDAQLAAQRGPLLTKDLLRTAELAGEKPLTTSKGESAAPLLTAAATAATPAQSPTGMTNKSFLEGLGQRLQQLSDQKAGLPLQGKFAKNMADLLNSKSASGQGGNGLFHMAAMLDKPVMTPHSPTSAPQATIHTPVGQPGWDQELSSRVTWLTKQNIPSAEIKLTPANLGPIEVKISVTNDQATVTMTAMHAMTRDALEQAIPRLRDMLSDAGLNLANANVFSQSQQGGQGGHQGFDHSSAQQGAGQATNQEDEQIIATSTVTLSSSGGVDLFV